MRQDDTDASRAADSAPMNPISVRVDLSGRGAWEVALPDQSERVICQTLEDAIRVARSCAAHRRLSELVVCDAYHRVLRQEHVNGLGRDQRDLQPRAARVHVDQHDQASRGG